VWFTRTPQLSIADISGRARGCTSSTTIHSSPGTARALARRAQNGSPCGCRLPAEYLFSLAEEWLRFLYPLAGRIAKVVVHGSDNTLWGAWSAKTVSPEFAWGATIRARPYLAPAARARRSLQSWDPARDCEQEQRSRRAYQRSKSIRPCCCVNVPLLRRGKSIGTRKAESLRRIAEELNVGLDTLVFVDDIRPSARRSGWRCRKSRFSSCARSDALCERAAGLSTLERAHALGGRSLARGILPAAARAPCWTGTGHRLARRVLTISRRAESRNRAR